MNIALRPWNLLMMAAVLAMAGMLAFELLAPKPSQRQSIRARLDAEKKVRDKTKELQTELDTMTAQVSNRLWKGSADSVGAQTLDLATKVAKTGGMKLSAFRPQKAVEDGELTRLSYVMTLEGRFPSLIGVVKELESPSHRLSVHLVQVASADEASDLVNATVGVTAFLDKSKKNTETKDKKA